VTIEPLRVCSLFSGIGGLDLGLERAGMKVVSQCEIDPYARRVLAKHWPGVPCHDDVTTREYIEGEADVVCGGFPCQDVSNNGKRAGLSAARSGLYRELVRAIRMVRPRYAVLENVAALLGGGMDRVLGDLAEIGYGAEWACIPACEVEAPHLRDRVFIVAHAYGWRVEIDCSASGLSQNRPWAKCGPEGLLAALADPLNDTGGCPKPLVWGVDDGVPNRMERIRGCGNAVVPQVGEVIGRAIVAHHRAECRA